MKTVEIPCGNETWRVNVPLETAVLRTTLAPLPALDAEACIQDALRALPHPPERPLVLVPDRTRAAHLPFWLPKIWRGLQELGSKAQELHCLFAAGTHAPMSVAEMRAAMGDTHVPVTLRSHDAAGPLELAGSGPDGEPIFLAPELSATDGALVLSTMSFHYLAGFGGGRKMLIPGVSDRETARRMHASCLQRDPPGRAAHVLAGTLDDNPLHRWILAALGQLRLPPLCGVCMVNDATGPIDAEGGALIEHHRKLAQRFSQFRTVCQAKRLDGVLLSCGGHPYDVDLVQVQKAIEAISPLLRPGARVAMLAALPRGLGHNDMGVWLRDGNARTQLHRLLDRFHIGQQTAWSLRRHLERYELAWVGNLPPDLADDLQIPVLADAEEAWNFVCKGGPHVAIAPQGGALRYTLASG